MQKPADHDGDPSGAPEMAARKLAAALRADGSPATFLVLFRVHGNFVEYAFENRPDPTLSGVDDAVLSAALIYAGSEMPMRRRKKLRKAERTRGMRSEGNEIVFKDAMAIDFDSGTIESTLPRQLALQALSIVVRNLVQHAVQTQPDKPPN
jgi:hypothetical protein